MKFDIEELERLHTEKLLIKHEHRSLPLVIWNYSATVQYTEQWNEIILQCRGLTTDLQGNVIAKPFKKFFNLGENKHVGSDNYTVWEKIDGSLIIVFWYNGEWLVSSRGSFYSDQAIWAKEILSDSFYDSWKEYADKGKTFLFELIVPENKIVIDYGEERALYLIGAVITDTGEELTPDESMVCNDWFKLPSQYHYRHFRSMELLNWENKEGFVVWFDNGHKVKIKFENYLVKHRIVWSLTNRLVWEYLSEGRVDELIDQVPDEFYEVVKKEIENLQRTYDFLENSYKNIFDVIMEDQPSRKDFAEKAKEFTYPQILFAMLDDKKVDVITCKVIYPKELRKVIRFCPEGE